MRKSRYSDEQIAAALRQAEIGTSIAEITRKLGISEATFYTWKKRFGTLGTPEIRELRQLRDENQAKTSGRRFDARSRRLAGRAQKKSGESGAPENSAPGSPQNLATERTQGLRNPHREPACSVLSVTSNQRRCGSVYAHQGPRRRSSSVRATAHLRPSTPRRLAREYQTRRADLSRRRPGNTNKKATTPAGTDQFVTGTATLCAAWL